MKSKKIIYFLGILLTIFILFYIFLNINNYKEFRIIPYKISKEEAVKALEEMDKFGLNSDSKD